MAQATIHPAMIGERDACSASAAHPRWLVAIGGDTFVRQWDGRTCGRVQAVTFDERSGRFADLVVRTGGSLGGGRTVRVQPGQLAEIGDGVIWLRRPGRASTAAAQQQPVLVDRGCAAAAV
jgi:sporulation protein YlmC with PRC-barrel domain